MSRLPDFIVIGAMKCATSTLHEQLAGQTGVFMCTPKEPQFFSDDEVYARGVDWYYSLFDDAHDDDLCGESSTHYTKLPTHPRTVERMSSILPDVKLIYVVRHPIDRLISHYVHEWSENRLRMPIDQAVTAYPEMVAYGRYAVQLKPYVDAYGPERILLIFFERLISRPHLVLEEICRFLGTQLKPAWNHALGPANVSRDRMRNSRIRDAIVNAPLISTVRRRFVPRAVRLGIKTFWRMRRPPQLSESTLLHVQETFDQDLLILGSWFGLELSCADFKTVAAAGAPRWNVAAMA